MPYTHLPIPMWARAVVGGCVSMIVAIGLAIRELVSPGFLASAPGVEISLVLFFAVLGVALIGYGVRVRGR